MKRIQIPQRIKSFGEKMHDYRLMRAQSIKDSKAIKKELRRAKKLAHSAPDNL